MVKFLQAQNQGSDLCLGLSVKSACPTFCDPQTQYFSPILHLLVTLNNYNSCPKITYSFSQFCFQLHFFFLSSCHRSTSIISGLPFSLSHILSLGCSPQNYSYSFYRQEMIPRLASGWPHNEIDSFSVLHKEVLFLPLDFCQPHTQQQSQNWAHLQLGWGQAAGCLPHSKVYYL